MATGPSPVVVSYEMMLTHGCVPVLLLQIMSKPFTPGADRLTGLKTHPSPVSATPVLDTSNAILDCTVVSGRR